jgi:toxin ParE1/3/4
MRRNKFIIRLLPVAEEDFTEIITYIAADRLSAAKESANRIEKNLELLSNNPYLGRVPKEKELAKAGYRFLVIDNYLLFYIVEGKTIYIHRIIHGARDYLSLL